MEGSTGDLPKQEVGYENKELQKKAEELAKETRERGMGLLHACFTYRNGGREGYNIKGYFIKGDEVPDGSYNFSFMNNGILIAELEPMHYSDIKESETWAKSKYRVPMEVITEKTAVEVPKKREVQVRVKRKFFGYRTESRIEEYKDKEIIDREVRTNNPLAYKGKRGDFDWIQYDYSFMTNAGGRDGQAFMSIAVPPDVARQIDEQVGNNVYFPDVFFKALYPTFQSNGNGDAYLRRLPSKGLRVIDLVKNPFNPKTDLIDQKGVVRLYPQPLNAKTL